MSFAHVRYYSVSSSQSLRSNKSINPTAGYGLPRFRISASAAAGYLQR